MLYEKIIRPVLFQFDAEKIHNFTINLLTNNLLPGILNTLFKFGSEKLKVKAGRLTFKNRIGLAAGMDKNCTALKSWNALGFGFAEVGTVTPLPQEGNEKPRMFRLPEFGGIINRLGFNNCGADEFEENLARLKDELPEDFIVGVNIGKNKRTELDNAYQDYKFSFEKCFEHADYFTINVSSPNTEGLRQLQQRKYLNEILKSLQALNKELDEKYSSSAKDIYLKIAPDLTEAELDDVLGVSIDNNITGIIATNTTISRVTLPEGKYEEGGLSGKPLEPIANSVIKYIKQKAGDKLVIIACGGVSSAGDVKEKLDLGASLVQIYTGLIYEGPGLIKRIKKGLVKQKSDAD
ncbi:MAG: quinone-dependent dihydroorotate dehydrogenase [Chlorobi bacterium]|nr:quinone-dependent dihydroorotate dehydrogenase [Chlorobiota bacterium]MCI0715632.1 quinone-dependent dihydroorotate dehydrogenase [Chlorobiota bacterium]